MRSAAKITRATKLHTKHPLGGSPRTSTPSQFSYEERGTGTISSMSQMETLRAWGPRHTAEPGLDPRAV